jgi:Protein of unknown function (DUF2637)
MTDMSAHARAARRAQHRNLTLQPWQAWAVGIAIGVIAAGLAVYSAAASYESVSGLAAARGVPLPRLNPLGLDGGLFGVIVINLALIWLRCPLWWLRLIARGFAVGTIAANAAAGWPDPVGIGLRIAAPALFVVLMEAGQAVLLRRHKRERQDGGNDGIPFARWLLAPASTFAIWRRMTL